MTNSSDEISQPSRSEDEKNILIAELDQSGINHSPEKIVRIARRSDGKIVFLEEGKGGERGSGLQHILEKHLKDFANRGISQEQIPDAIITAIIEGKIVRYQQQDRPIYEVSFNGKRQLIAVTVANNGYIVCANPCSLNLLRD